ncbi:hypothetical protein [Streptomyces umbrinus]|uniref:hypothetical protein n=1 Tax=Streptomyces umbrinus TaxID=67370 RepID=UPI003434CD7C
MPSSIAYTPRPPGGQDAVEAERDNLLDLLRAVRDALDVPLGNRRQAMLDDRVLLVHGTLRDVLDGQMSMGVQWETDLLRRRVAEDGGPDA